MTLDLRALARATEAFYAWELAGRGWRSFAHYVGIEPEYRPFPGHRPFPATIIDDARKPTVLSRLFRPAASGEAPPVGDDDADEGGNVRFNRSEALLTAEFEILVPPDTKIDPATFYECVQSLASTRALCFELLGYAGHVTIRLAGSADEASWLLSQLRAFFPAATIREPELPLGECCFRLEGSQAAIEFGLAEEFMLPLRIPKASPDPLTALVGALVPHASSGGMSLLQVLFKRARAPWATDAERALISPDGEPFFVDAPEMLGLAKEKFATPLYAVCIRAMAIAEDADTAQRSVFRLAAALGQYAAPGRNSLIPLATPYPADLIEDVIDRATRRSGMLLSLAELTSIARLPSEHLRTPALLREPLVLRRLPAVALSDEGVAIGSARHLDRDHDVRVPIEARLQHTHIIGASGTGKSTLLESLILQDIRGGRGVGVVDPHGDLCDSILSRIPEERIDDVVFFDPSDDEGVIGWNILGAHSEVEKELLASDLVSVFRRLSTSWGDQMSVLLANAVLAFLESSRGGTLVELRKFLLDDDYRAAFLRTVGDDHVRSFWQEEYPLLIGKKPQAPILTRLDTFLRSKLIRERVTERENPLNFRDLIDSGRIFLARLSQGAIGEENAALLGSLLVSKFHQVALSRQDLARTDRRPFFLYIDEFQQVATASMAGLFSGVRKYNLALTVAHQDLYQLHASAPELERSALTNAYTRIVFRVSDQDARRLERDMGNFTAGDLTNLGRGHAVCRLERSDSTFALTTAPLPRVDAADAELRQRRIRRTSIARWGRSRVAPNMSRAATVAQAPTPSSENVPKPQREAPAPKPKTTEPSSPGRGGAVHKYLQGLISECAQKHGFKAEIECGLPGGGRVDVVLTRDELRIACEVAGTTTIDQEMANVRKCLTNGFSHVCSISLDLAFLRRLEAALAAKLSDVEREHVHFLSTEEFLAFIGAQMMTQSARRVAGYKVEVRQADRITDATDRKRIVADVMLKSIRRMKEKQ